MQTAIVLMLLILGDAACAQPLRPQIGTPLSEVMKLISGKDFAGALLKVSEADMVKDKTPFEEYQVSKYAGFIAINQQMPDYAAATVAYNRQVTSGGAPDADKSAMYSIALRLNYQRMDYGNVIKDATELSMIRPLDDTELRVLMEAKAKSDGSAVLPSN
jgi:hypothetical protein